MTPSLRGGDHTTAECKARKTTSEWLSAKLNLGQQMPRAKDGRSGRKERRYLSSLKDESLIDSSVFPFKGSTSPGLRDIS